MYRCASVFVLFVLLASAMAQTERDQEILNHERCVAETGFGRDIPNATDENRDQLMASITGCYVSCLWKAENLLKEDGTLNAVECIKRIPENSKNRDLIIQALNECVNNKGASDCETASKTIACLKRSQEILTMESKKKTFLRA